MEHDKVWKCILRQVFSGSCYGAKTILKGGTFIKIKFEVFLAIFLCRVFKFLLANKTFFLLEVKATH